MRARPTATTPNDNYPDHGQGGGKSKGKGKGKEDAQPKAAAKAKAKAKPGASPWPPWQTPHRMVVKPNKADPMYALRKATEAATRASGADSDQAQLVKDLERRMQRRYEEELPPEKYLEVLTKRLKTANLELDRRIARHTATEEEIGVLQERLAQEYQALFEQRHRVDELEEQVEEARSRVPPTPPAESEAAGEDDGYQKNPMHN